MIKRILACIAVVLPLAALYSCNDDYIIGGEVNSTERMTINSFELLSMNDETAVVAELFELAGMKDRINGEVTLLAPNKWSVNRYLRRKNSQLKKENPDAPQFTIKDIPADELKQMEMYVFPGQWWRETIPEEGVFLTAIDGTTEIRLTLDKTYVDPGAAWDGGRSPGAGYQFSNFMMEVPYIIHVLFKRGNNWELTHNERAVISNSYDNPECDHYYRMYVSDIRTSNGVVHVLYMGDEIYNDHYYYHSLFFFGTRDDDQL